MLATVVNHTTHSMSNNIIMEFTTLHDALTLCDHDIQSQTTNVSLCQMIRNAINIIDTDSYKELCVQQIIPVIVSSKTLEQDKMAYRYAIILCRNIIGRSNCEILTASNGFIYFIQQAMLNNHRSISMTACDAMMKLIAHSPRPDFILKNNELSETIVLHAAIEHISPNVDSNKCLDAIRVVTLMNKNKMISPVPQLCNNLVSTFYDNQTPFVSKQTAGLILQLIENDQTFKQPICDLLVEHANPNKPIQAAKCWSEVNDVMLLVN